MKAGDKFPLFTLFDENGEALDNGSLHGRRYIIYFYSKDGTAGCTKEALDFSSLFDKFASLNVAVIGVSKDSVATHKKFKEKNSLKIKLLSDSERVLMEKTGVWGTKMMYGKEVQGTIRSTFIVGADGVIEAVWKGVKVQGHAEKVLEKVSSLAK